MHKPIRAAALLSCIAVAFAASDVTAQYATDDSGELTYINCQAGFGIIFPAAPSTRDIRYTTNTGRTVPARQFYLQRGQDLLQVTVARFDYGPPVNEPAMDHAAAALKARGEVKYEAAGDYDPGYPARQLSMAIADGRQLRASVFMMEHKLYIIEALAAPGDVEAIQFEQSITMVNEMGIDYDQNPPDPIHKLNCRSDFFRR